MSRFRFSSVLFFAFCLVSFNARAQYTEADIYRYIDDYKDVAMDKMRNYKIPASITLAQGIFESACGMSKLATEGNNHFGIKCHNDWNGDTIRIDDDELQECFRKYEKVEDSYTDHSLFLTSRKRYKSLFSLEVMDYVAWAKGLKAAGYATNPEYAGRLIKLIETYGIARYDTLAMTGKTDAVPAGTQERQQPAPTPGNPLANKGKMVAPVQQVVAPVAAKPEPKSESKEPIVIPVENVEKEVVTPVPAPAANKVAVFTAQPSDFPRGYCPWARRVVYENNRTQFVIAGQGDTYASIAKDVERSEKEILKYNDAFPESTLTAGQVVYIEQKSKKNEAVHVVSQGETLRYIAQKYAVQLQMLYFYNGLSEESVIKPNDKILMSN